MSAPRATRLAIVLSHPTQYYSPWFRWLHTHIGLTVRVFYLWDFGVTERRDPEFERTFRWDVDLLTGYDHEFVPNVANDPGTHHFRGLRNPSIVRRLAAWRPSAVLLFGYNWETHLRVVAWARWRRVPLLFRGDSHFLGRGAPPPFRRFALNALYSQFAAFLVVGTANAEYFATLGVPRGKCFFSPHAVDAAHFDPTLPQHRAAATALRAELGLAPATTVVLFAGKLIAAKQPDALLKAFLETPRPGVALVFVGDGPERASLVERARQAPTGSVHFLPFANQSEMPARLLLADVFVLPSRSWYETWGLAVNEAMHMGVPALVSDLVGCQRDLVTEGKTGWVFEASQTGALRAALDRALAAVASSPERARLRDAVRQRMQRYTYDRATAGLIAALDRVESR